MKDYTYDHMANAISHALYTLISARRAYELARERLADTLPRSAERRQAIEAEERRYDSWLRAKREARAALGRKEAAKAIVYAVRNWDGR